MTALDQAFIKAFAQQRVSPALRVSCDAGKSTTPAAVALPGNATEAARRSCRQAALEPPLGTLTGGESRLSASRAPLPPLSASIGGVWAALERPRSAPATLVPKDEPPLRQAGAERINQGCESTAPEVSQVCHGDEAIDRAPDCTSALPLDSEHFKAAWQIPSFTWPKVCRQMLRQAGEQLRGLAESVSSAGCDGRAVLAIAGCRRGEGASTLLLCVARQLAQQGIHTVIVDADLRCPVLAKRLGVQPQMGWDEAVEPCDQAVIEAEANHIALLPLKERSDVSETTNYDWSALADRCRRLRKPYGIVLVDVGSLGEIGIEDRDSAGRFARAIDGVLLVHNGRITSSEELGDVERQLASAGTSVLGVIENFVSGHEEASEIAAA